jgi:hypothetical protein
MITHDIQKSIFILESKGALWKDYLNFVRMKNKKRLMLTWRFLI